MSELADLTNPGKDGPLPGYTLSRPGLVQYAKAEEHFADEYFDGIKRRCAGLAPMVTAEVMKAAAEDIKLGKFRYPGAVFDIHALAKTTLPHLTLWSLQVKHRDMTLAKVVDLLTGMDDVDALAGTIYELWGYVSKKPDADGVTADGQSPSTGSPSSGDAPPLPPPVTG